MINLQKASLNYTLDEFELCLKTKNSKTLKNIINTLNKKGYITKVTRESIVLRPSLKKCLGFLVSELPICGMRTLIQVTR